MIQQKKSVVLIALTMLICLLPTCKKNEFKKLDCSQLDSKYSTSIKPIISANCTISGCHDGSTSQADLTTYAKLEPYLSNGKFNEVVIKNKSMPKNKNLSQDQRNRIKCWLDDGAPNN